MATGRGAGLEIDGLGASTQATTSNFYLLLESLGVYGRRGLEGFVKGSFKGFVTKGLGFGGSGVNWPEESKQGLEFVFYLQS